MPIRHVRETSTSNDLNCTRIAPALVQSECVLAFEAKDSNYAIVSDPLRSCETDGLGLDTVAAAAAAARGRAWLSTHTDSHSGSVHTVFHVRLPAFKGAPRSRVAFPSCARCPARYSRIAFKPRVHHALHAQRATQPHHTWNVSLSSSLQRQNRNIQSILLWEGYRDSRHFPGVYAVS